MRSIILGLLGILTFGFATTACTQSRNQEVDATIEQITLQPYMTLTPTMISLVASESTPAFANTKDPVIYTVVSGDSLSVIALRFGVELNALILANPNVNPNTMSIGTKLVIPEKKDSAADDHGNITSLPTPAAQVNKDPDCYRTTSDDWLCFLLVQNTGTEAVSNIAGTLLQSGSDIAYPASYPLDILPAGKAGPLVARIQDSALDPNRMSGRLTSAIPVDPSSDRRFAIVQISSQVISYAEDQRSANIQGQIVTQFSGPIRVLAYAQNNEGEVLGFRVMDISSTVQTGSAQAFSLTLYSLNGEINEIRLEAQVKLR